MQHCVLVAQVHTWRGIRATAAVQASSDSAAGPALRLKSASNC